MALGALQAQNTVTVSNVSLQEGDTAVVSVALTNETEFTAFQMDLVLPEGFAIATTVNEDGEGVLDITLNADRKKSTHSLTSNVLDNGVIRIGSYSSTNATFKGTSGTLVEFRVVATAEATFGDHVATLFRMLFSTPDAVESDLGIVEFGISYSEYVPVNIVSVNEVMLHGVGDKAVLAVDLQNETEFSAFVMDLKLPTGFVVPATMNKDGEEVLDIQLNADRKKSSHSLSYNVLSDGTIRFVSFSNTGAVFKGTSGTIVEIALMATEEATESDNLNVGTLVGIDFATPDAMEYNLGTLDFAINYSRLTEAEAAILDSAAILVKKITEYDELVKNMYPEYTDNALYESIYSCVEVLESLGGYTGELLFSEYSRIATLFEVLEAAIPQMAALKLANDAFKKEVNSTEYPGKDAALTAWELVETFVWSAQANSAVILQEIQEMVTYLEKAKQEYQASYIPDVNLSLTNGQYGRCILNGNLVQPKEQYAAPLAQGSTVTMYFVPFNEYMLKSMKRNGEVVVVRDNCYEEVVSEDVTYTDLRFEAIVDTVVVTETVIVEKVDTLIITEIEELPTPVITCENGVVTITCEETDVTILYAINGDPLEGSVYTAPFEVAEDAVVSAVAVRRGDKAELSVQGTGVAQSRMRVVSRRYYNENGVELTSPEDGVTIVAAEYEDGSTRVFKMVKK